jgi:hypothetical protein
VTDREYAVWVFDSATDASPRIEVAGSRQQAEKRVGYYQALDGTRSTYDIGAKVVFRYAFMPDMDWEDA